MNERKLNKLLDEREDIIRKGIKINTEIQRLKHELTGLTVGYKKIQEELRRLE
ncbi:MAG: hypothetical protein GWN01_05495 [Nitrosopumilaceae archaeon]|nr:hypothetical protein [Nitrosopumilaceae archaeon]NIU86799.1 hypothetical protein [Nitrosopumilaceae archaeon]NIX60999.1 hypothetical protein [Nitrosopumilaceae archaeon]